MVREKVFSGEVNWLQILDENGNVDHDLEPKLSNDELDRMYRLMVLSRTFDEKAFSLQRQGRIGTYGQLKGQEAAQVGSAICLDEKDWIFPNFRQYGAFITRGMPLDLMYIFQMGFEEGDRIPENINIFTVCVPVATQLPHAAGAAWAAKIKGHKTVVITYFGDGASSEGDFHEAMNFAGVFRLPVVFICENNQFAISVPRSKQTASKTLAQKALAYGFDGIQVDGNDVLAVFSATKEAVEKARSGGGPAMIECYTYRIGDHTTADDASRYRTKEEVESWIKKDPIKRFRIYLTNKGIWNQNYEDAVIKESSEKIEAAVKKAEEFRADPMNMFKYVYAEITPNLKEQMESLQKEGLLKESKGVIKE